MELMPLLSLGLLNGWLPFLLLSIVTWGGLVLVPGEVSKRLLDRTDFSKKQKTFLMISKSIAIIDIVLISLTPLKLGTLEFQIGVFLLILGLVGLVVAMFDFKNTPFGKPVTTGLYKLSRHPINVTQAISILGICIAIGSWIALLFLILSKIPAHFITIAEEEFCLRKYGDSYREYMKHVPRYIMFF